MAKNEVQSFGYVEPHTKAVRRLHADIQCLTNKELKDTLINEIIRRRLTRGWIRQTEKDAEIKKKQMEKERRKKQEESERQQAFQKTPLYKFRLLAQLVDQQKRIDGLSQWSLEDLRTVLKEVTPMTTMTGIPAYRFRESREDLNNVITQKVNLESS